LFGNASERGPRKVGFGNRPPPGSAPPPATPVTGRGAAPPHAQVERLSFAYDGRLGEAMGLVLANLALTVLTLGVYRFWAKTRYRRYIWSRVRMLDEPFEYTGRGIHLFVGFVVAMVIVLPPTIAWSIGSEALQASNPGLLVLLSMVAPIAFYVLGQAGVYQARRYRLRHSAWRGIRFGMAGSAFGYAFLAAGCLIVTWMSLGLLAPWSQTRLAGVRWNNTRFGDRAFRFDASSVPLLGRWMLALALAPFTLGVSIVWYRVWQARYYTEAVSFEGMRFHSGLKTSQVLGPVVLGLVAFALLAVPLALPVMLAGLPDLENLQQNPDGTPVLPIWEMAAAGVTILACVALGTAINQAYVTPALVQRYVEGLEGMGAVDLAAIAQSSEAAPRRGEGLTAMFDVGGGI